jgi:hypothetical protein
LRLKDRVSADGGSSSIDLLTAVDAVPGISATTIAKTSSRRAAASGPLPGSGASNCGNGEPAAPDNMI